MDFATTCSLNPPDRYAIIPCMVASTNHVSIVMFTDLTDSVGMTLSLGDRRAQDVIRRHDATVRAAIVEHGGREVNHTGDGILAEFTTPTNAVMAAVLIQRALRNEGIKARVGLDAGEPVIDQNNLFGRVVQHAARICARASPETVLVSDVVKSLCSGGGFRFVRLGPFELKGFDSEFLFQVEQDFSEQLLDRRIWRNYLERALPRELRHLKMAQKIGRTLVFIDVDDMTLLNRHLGVVQGDGVLKRISVALTNHPSVETCGLCGDDTFFAVLYANDPAKALQSVERIWRHVMTHAVSDVDASWNVTITASYAVYRDPHEPPEGWLDRAGRGLVLGKRNGGNRVEPEIPEDLPTYALWRGRPKGKQRPRKMRLDISGYFSP